MNPADPRLTAYADGALSRHDTRSVAKELEHDPEARAELEEIRALQRGLRAAFAEGAGVDRAAAWPVPRVAPPPPRFCLRNLALPLTVVVCLAVIFVAFAATEVGATRESARRARDAVDLQRIGLACRFFSSSQGARLPVANHVWDFARQLATHGGLTEGDAWLVESDSAAPENWTVDNVLSVDGKSLSPEFIRARLSYAVLLSGLPDDAPFTTPIAWTRGLRSDGTWAPDSPYRGEGGHVVFADGEVRFFRKVDRRFTRYDGQGETSDILEALPPGARIGEAR